MTKDEINSRIAEREAELKTVSEQLNPNGQAQLMPLQQLSNLTRRKGQLMTDIASLKALLDET